MTTTTNEANKSSAASTKKWTPRISLTEARAAVKAAGTRSPEILLSYLMHCDDAADAEKTIRLLRSNQPALFHEVRQPACENIRRRSRYGVT